MEGVIAEPARSMPPATRAGPAHSLVAEGLPRLKGLRGSVDCGWSPWPARSLVWSCEYFISQGWLAKGRLSPPAIPHAWPPYSNVESLQGVGAAYRQRRRRKCL